MFFRKKTPTPDGNQAAPPPWVNIDTIPKKSASSHSRFDLADFVSSVTGFGRIGARIFLIGAALSFAFIAYLLLERIQMGPPPPPDVNRPAMDKYASSTTLR